MILSILGKTYKVEYVPYSLAETTEGYQTGGVDYDSCIIKIMTENRGVKTTEEALSQCLWHEIVHAFNDAMQMDLDKKNIERLATAMNMFVQENRDFFKEVQDEKY